MIPFFQALFERFQALHADIRKALDSIPDEALDWSPGEEMNSMNVLVVHLTGAERFLISEIVMGEPSNRDREAEFHAKGWSRADLLDRLAATEAATEDALGKLGLDDLERLRTHPRHGNQVSVAWALLHALEHAGVHVGHIELTAQLWAQSYAGRREAD